MPKGILKSLSESEDRLISLIPIFSLRASLVAQMEKNPPAMRENWVQSLAWEDPLKRRTTTHRFLLGEFHGQRLAGYIVYGAAKHQTQLSDFHLCFPYSMFLTDLQSKLERTDKQ